MNKQVEDTDVKDTVERLKQKYLDKKRQFLQSDDISNVNQASQRFFISQRSKPTRKEFQCYTDALMELFKSVTTYSDQFDCDRALYGSEENLSADSTAAPPPDSQVLFTETDVTLPSCVDGSSGSPGTERDRKTPTLCRISGSRTSASFSNVYQEMMIIYEQLQEERQSQQERERELYEKEKRLKQQEEVLRRLAGLEEEVQTHLTAPEKRRQQEINQLRIALQEKCKENHRLKSNFDTIRELNDNMKKQLIEISEQNKKLETQSQRVQARLHNLQKKYELDKESTGCQKESVKSSQCIQSSRKQKGAVPGKHKEKPSSGPSSHRFVGLLLDWVLDGHILPSVAEIGTKAAGMCLNSETSLTERFIKMLPLLADELHQTSTSNQDHLFKLLRLTYWALTHLEKDTHKQVVVSATLRRIGEEMLKSACQSSVLQFKGVDLTLPSIEAAGAFSSSPLHPSPRPQTRILSTLIILCTITKADDVAQVLLSLRSDLVTEDSRGFFLHYGGVHVLLPLLRHGRAGLQTPLDILMQLTQPSRYLNVFLEACSDEEFFKTASKLLKDPRLEMSLLEKICILLQKLSTIRRNRRLFELSSVRLQIEELHHKTEPKHTFLLLNLKSILHNLQ